jgi:hypothetical protein
MLSFCRVLGVVYYRSGENNVVRDYGRCYYTILYQSTNYNILDLQTHKTAFGF